MKIFFTVTNDLSYDQRMIRICTSLANNGFEVCLIGRKKNTSISLGTQPFHQKRLNCFFEKGKLFYLEYNLRLFFFLLFKKMDCIVAVDLDTILPCYFISVIKKTKRVYDAHELFCEMKEIVSRPKIYKIWKRVEQFAVPKFSNAYTVNHPIVKEFKQMYGIDFEVIRNVPVLNTEFPSTKQNEKIILYQGAVNEGRCFESLIPAMKKIDCKLVIYGDGNFLKQAKQLVIKNNVSDRIFFKGNVAPSELKQVTQQAYIGINLVENNGLSNYLSLANKFFDYMHAEIPQLCSGFPAYKEINDQFNVAVLTTDMNPDNLATLLNNLLGNEVLYNELKNNCRQAKQLYNWQKEEITLLNFYKQLFG